MEREYHGFLALPTKEEKMSWKPEVRIVGESGWHGNALRFATEQEARENASDLSRRWMLVNGTRAVESDEPVNYTYHDGELKAVECASNC